MMATHRYKQAFAGLQLHCFFTLLQAKRAINGKKFFGKFGVVM
jgi:hypothetical protein